MKDKKKATVRSLHFTDKFTRAVDYARQVHVECRKETQVPYMAHLLGVAALVIGENGYVNFPVTEDMVIAALLHDAVEDQGGLPRLRDIEANFGRDVARMVEGCTDSFVQDSANKPPWEERKRAYLKRLRKESLDTQLISQPTSFTTPGRSSTITADQSDIWKRFKRGREDQLWYFNGLLDAFKSGRSNRIVDELGRVVAELARVSDANAPSPASTPRGTRARRKPTQG